MAEEIVEDNTPSVQEEEETTEKIPHEETPSPEKKVEVKVELTDRERRLLERARKAEENAKERKAELDKFLANSKKNDFSDVDAILEVQRATSGLDPREVGELKVRANAMGISLTEARENEDFKLWQSSYKEKVDKEKAPIPSTTQSGDGKERTDLEILDSNRGTYDDFMNPDPKKEEVLKKSGLWKDPQKRKEVIPLSN